MSAGGIRTPKVGKLRPSQAVTQHGPGAVVDLPELSVIVAGINHWRPTAEDVVPEPRLQNFLQVQDLFRPPQPGPGKFGGLPTFVFPEYLVCPDSRCRMLAHHSKFHRSAGWNYAEYRCPREEKHRGKGKRTAFPARFMVACPKGHLDDFPWHDWVHGSGGAPCSGVLELHDLGSTGSANDLQVVCTGCDEKKRMGDAFDGSAHSGCSGRRPWLHPNDQETCGETQRTILRGASNAYFSVVASAISIPPWSDPLHQEIAPHLAVIRQADSLEKLKLGIEGGFYDLGDLTERYALEEIWAASNAKPETEDLRLREWKAFTNPDESNKPGTEFEVTERGVNRSFQTSVAQVVAATRLREVRALRGFTRLDSMPEAGDIEDVEELNISIAPISDKRRPSWLPAIDLRGEGVFLRLAEDGPDGVKEWERRPEVVAESERLEQRWHEWRKERELENREFPGMRYVLVHTLSHVLMRQLSLESGYSSSSVRERLYVESGAAPMAGILLYTATSDSDGSLGGLVDQARPDRLGPLMLDALREASRCAQDPLCAGRDVDGNAHMNGAACHACLLLAETSCESSNRLLDRNLLVPTLDQRGVEFFRGIV